MDDLVEDGGGAVPHEGPLPAEQLVEDHARGEDVAAPVELLAADLLRAHVVDGAHHHARLGDPGPAELGDAEVHDLHRAVLEQADVRGLDVAVHDAVLVREVQAAQHLHHDLQLLLQEERLSRAHQRLEVHAREQLHRDEGEAPVLAQLEDGDDVGVLQPRRGPGLDLEALAALLVERALDGEGLDRHLALQDLVPAAVDHPHPAPPDAAHHRVLPDPAPRGLVGLVRGQHQLTRRSAGGGR